MTDLISITDKSEVNLRILALHKQWTPTMEVSVWGRGKATRTDKRECPDQQCVGKAEYPGDCDNCSFFMGAKFEPGRKYYWGDYAKACCALELEKQVATPEAPHA